MIFAALALIQKPYIEVDPSQVLGRITPAMYGVCIENVNHEIYGGLYGQRLFGESFEEPAPRTDPKGWRNFGACYYPDGDGIHIRGGSGPKLVREMPDMADGTVEASLVLSNDMGENAGLLVRVAYPGVGADSFDGYEVSLSAKARKVILGKHRNDFQSLATADAPVIPGRFHRLRVALAGPRIRVYLDGESTPRIDFTDANQPLLKGRVALRTWQADATFRDIRIDEERAPTSLASEGVSAQWDGFRTGAAKAKFSVEGGGYNGIQCQRLDHDGAKGTVGIANRGLNRWGISVRAGLPMEGRLYLRGDVGTATVSLQSVDGKRTYASQRVKVGKNWAKQSFRLLSRTTDPNARFTISIDHKGTLWADQAVLMDADRFAGLPLRGDIARKMAAGGLTFLRYGGTMINVPGYRWKKMIGDPDRRPPYIGHWYPASTNGFGIFDFLRFAEAAKVGAAFAINPEETPEDVADLADYLTAPVTTEWGRKRAQDGHPEPYRFEYLQIGNEEAIGNPSGEAMAHYAERFRLLAKAIHSRNPKIKLVCSAWWIPDSPHMKTVFDAVDGVAAAWDFHFWSDDPNSGPGIDRELKQAHALFLAWNPKTTLKAVVFEENGNRHDFQRALGHATTLNASRANGDFVLVDCAANGLQPWRQNDNGWDQGQVFFSPDKVWGTPPYETTRLLAGDHLPIRIHSRYEYGLNVLATRSEDGRNVHLTVVNTGDRPISIPIVLRGFEGRLAKSQVLEAGPFRHPLENDGVIVRKIAFGGDNLIFPPRSIASLRFSRR